MSKKPNFHSMNFWEFLDQTQRDLRAFEKEAGSLVKLKDTDETASYTEWFGWFEDFLFGYKNDD